MKKYLILTIAMLAALGSFAQTTITSTRTILSDKDTLVTVSTRIITAKTVYDTANIVSYDTLEYKPDTTYHRPKYKFSGSLSYANQSNLVIKLDSINSNLQNINQIVLTNCSNVHISKCYLMNTTGYAITLNNCTNVLVDSCVFNKVAFGVNVNHGSGIKINHNQGLNRYDVGNTGGQRSHWVQTQYVSGGGNQVNYNRFEDITGQALHPHDGISIWHSNGIVGDSIQVIGNWIRGVINVETKLT